MMFDPPYPCREMPTRGCPDSYGGVCGDRPCARYESEDPAPWCICPPIETTALGQAKPSYTRGLNLHCPVHGGELEPDVAKAIEEARAA
jgi:hypothetical protein